MGREICLSEPPLKGVIVSLTAVEMERMVTKDLEIDLIKIVSFDLKRCCND